MGERPVAVFKPSLAALLGTATLRVVVGVLAVGVVERYEVRGVPEATKEAFLHWLVLAICAMVALDLLFAFAVRTTTSLAVFPDRMTYSRGVLARRTTRVWTREIVGVDVGRTVLGRLLGYGTVIVDTRGVDTITVPRIADAGRVVDVFDEARAMSEARHESARSGTTDGAPGGPRKRSP